MKTRYPLVIILHGIAPGASSIDWRMWQPPPVSMLPPAETAEQRLANDAYLRSVIEGKT